MSSGSDGCPSSMVVYEEGVCKRITHLRFSTYKLRKKE